MGRAGREKGDDAPERRCIVTGEVGPKAGLIRFVVGPGEVIVPDLAGKLPGRGIWVSADRAALEKAVAKKLFSRAAKAPVKVPDGFAEAVEAGLAQRVTELLSLARKAGQAVMGFEKVKAMVEAGGAAVLLQASDGSERGRSKLRLDPARGPTIDWLTAGEIGLSFGRDHAIHAALGAGGLTPRIVEDANRLSGLRGRVGATPPERT